MRPASVALRSSGGRRLALLVAAALCALVTAIAVARADGEAGVVIDDGTSTRTFCVAFEGESITGEDLLRRAGITFEQFGGGARTMCSLDGQGCSDASSFDSCFCECKSGSGSCTYWAFFIQRYGASWQYSTIGFNLAEVRDGDMHGWKWGSGSLQSAPPPAGTTFENVCGHSPRGGAAPPTATPTATSVPPTATPTTASTATPAASESAAAAGSATASATPTETPGEATPGTTAAPSLSPTTTAIATPASVTVTLSATADLPETDDSDDGGGSSIATWAGFGAVAAVLLAGIAGAAAWRQRRER